MAREKTLKYETLTSPWGINDAPEEYNAIHKEDPMTHLKRFGDTTAKKITAAGITHVKEIKSLINDEWTHLRADHKISKIIKMLMLAKKAATVVKP